MLVLQEPAELSKSDQTGFEFKASLRAATKGEWEWYMNETVRT